MNFIKVKILFVLLTFVTTFSQEANFTISGFIYDKNSGETMIGANVYVNELGVGTSSNEYGFFSLTLPKGKYTIVISFVGYKKVTQKINLNNSLKIDFRISSTSYNLDEVVVEEEKGNENIKSTKMGTKDLVPKEIDKIPILFGERDLLKTIQLLPGVSSAGEGSSGFVVRGGTADQNLVILDEAPVYNASHLLGFFSVFNSDAIKNAKIIKGIAGPEYGGRLSSVLDISMKDGSNKNFSAYGGIGLISSRLTLEGPILEDKSSFLISGRRTYADLFFPLFGDEIIENSALYFYDINAKLNFTLSENDRLFISAYNGRDVFNFNNEFGFDWGNTTATLRWNHIFSNKLFSNTTFMYSNYNYDINIEDIDQAITISSGIRNINLKEDLEYYLSASHSIRIGLNGIYHTFTPGEILATGKSNFNSLKVEENHALEGNLYIGHEWSIVPTLKLDYGLRFSNFTLIGPGETYNFDSSGDVIYSKNYQSGEVIKSYNNLEPRFALNYLFNETSSLKVGYARNTQNVHLLSTSTTTTPLDIWQPSSAIIKPEISDLISIGYFRNFYYNQYAASVELYYKNMQNLIEYKNGADIFLNKFVESQLVFGNGWAYGLEFFFEKKVGKFSGWISYTLSTTKRKFNEINNGNPFPARQDRTHDVSIVAMYDMNDAWSFSANWVYYTGLAVTYPAGKYNIDGLTVNYYTDRNAQRMPDYHRLDLGTTYYLKRSKNKEMSLTFSIYNVYARENAYTINFQENENNPKLTQAVRVALFSIVPSITFNFRF